LIMSQERLSGLVILPIEMEILAEIEHKNILSNLAPQKSK